MKRFERVRSRLSSQKAYLLLRVSDQFADLYNAKCFRKRSNGIYVLGVFVFFSFSFFPSLFLFSFQLF